MTVLCNSGSLQIRPLSYALGAEIIGIDLRKPLDDQSFNEIHTAFLEHCVLLFRGQTVTSEQHVAFSRRFGKLDSADATSQDRHPAHPEILFVTNKPKPNRKRSGYSGQVWHTDQVHMITPAMATVLRGIEVPEVGGDTMFANMYLAYETLSDGMKKLIDGLYGVHFGGKGQIDNPPVAQPLVRVHPETGRKALYLGEKAKQLVGMTLEESEPLIQFLCRHGARPQFVYRHQWRKDDLLIWDNRCTTHIATNDYDKTQTRHLERTIVKGTPSGYVYEGPLQYDGPRL